MIRGHFNEVGQLYFTLDFIVENETLSVDALFDTGFTGLVAINKQDIDGLDWTFIRGQPKESLFLIFIWEL